jgi:hypothetical protein
MRRSAVIILGLVYLLGCRQVCVAQSAQCAPREGVNGSRLCVTLGFRDGKLVVDRNLSKLNASTQFQQRLSPALKLSEVQAKYFDQLDQTLADRKRPYQLALTEAELAKDLAGQLNDPLTVELRTFSGSFQQYRQRFEPWVAAAPGRKSFATIFGGEVLDPPDGLYLPLQNLGLNNIALLFNDNTDEINNDFNTATFSLTAVDPVDNWADPNQVTIDLPNIDDAKKQARLERIQKKLAPLRGQIWDQDAITATITAYYRQLNLAATVTVSGVTSDLSITITEARRIASIILPPQGNNNAASYHADIDKILYILLPDTDFRTFIKKRDSIIPNNLADTQPSTDRPSISYATKLDPSAQTTFTHQGPYVDASRLQIQQLLLAQIGYIANLEEAGGSTLTGQYVALNLQKIADTPETPPETPKAAPPTTDNNHVVTGQQQEAKPNTEFTSRNTPKTEQPNQTLKEKKNYLGGGFEYRPGQGVHFFGLGQRSQLRFPFQNGSLSATAGGNQGGIGSINYLADYIWFNRLHRRVSLQLSGGSDYDANRMVAGQQMDERRTSGLARIEFEPFRDKAGSLLRFHVEGRQTIVALRENDAKEEKQHLTTLDLGGLFTFESIEAEYPRRFRLEPVARFGLGLAFGTPTFTKLKLTSNFHQTLPHRLAADISGSLGLASRDTPMFELPSLGGAESLRGFRRDDALGRRFWSLQNELWLPLPRTATAEQDGLKAFLRDNIRLAPFVDVGGLYLPNNSKAGLRSGYGLGLRIIYNIIILKVDYAYGVGAAATGGSRGKFYFSIGSNLPF